MSEETPYDLNPHEEMEIDIVTTCIRVPGGWIYKSFNENNICSAMSFVPFSAEFQVEKDEIKWRR